MFLAIWLKLCFLGFTLCISTTSRAEEVGEGKVEEFLGPEVSKRSFYFAAFCAIWLKLCQGSGFWGSICVFLLLLLVEK